MPLLAIRDLLADWSLTPDGDPRQGSGSIVVPVTTAEGVPAALKVGAAGERPGHEHLALQRWGGRGAVRLLRADPGRRALLLERLEPEDLSERWDVEACEIVASRYADLHVPPMPQLRSQATLLRRQADELARDAHGVPVPRRLVEQTLALVRDLVADPPVAVVHGDLHYGHLLRGRRDGERTGEHDEGAWLAIDPDPVNGDPHSELEPMLRERFDEYAAPWAAGSVRDGIRRRFHTLVDAAGLDEDRARDWVVVRSVLSAHRERADRDRVTARITVAKAVQD
ncbi:aminoglycoside resistance protein [Nocardioides albidus]|uniref:Aminoglycoside resistance protein n=1 Tax=Nocardioides albidus TaxID=1517589 RepID=A0A5C4VZ66_9ACTN|nr:aminoglycoside phosphotransferase family protein [Nocardioides albidus]TNM41210.1 aminoglycoside resistance protein [Nocardioides albidus]